MRAWAWVGLMLWCVVAGCAMPIEAGRVQPPADALAFRRCYPYVVQTYCSGLPCQRQAEEVYVDPRTRTAAGAATDLHAARRAWLKQWGCPTRLIDDR